MKWLTAKRIIRAGILDFSRNTFVSFASVLTMVETLFILGLMLFSGVILNTTFNELRDKADINVYFVTTAPEDSILEIKASLEALPEIARVEYLSRDEALAVFRERHQNDQLTLSALDELGDNPLGAVLNVKAKDISQYESVAAFLKDQQTQAGVASVIEKINFYDEQHRTALQNLQEITASGGKLGLVVIIIFMVTTITTLFNMIRLTIYMSRDEIQVMRLVGAGAFYIRAPFMVKGILEGFSAGVITLLLFYPLAWWLGDATQGFFGGVNIYSYYLSHFLFFFAVMVLGGVLIGGISNFLAVRRYLKI